MKLFSYVSLKNLVFLLNSHISLSTAVISMLIKNSFHVYFIKNNTILCMAHHIILLFIQVHYVFSFFLFFFCLSTLLLASVLSFHKFPYIRGVDQHFKQALSNITSSNKSSISTSSLCYFFLFFIKKTRNNKIMVM